MVPRECPGHSNTSKYLSWMIMDNPFYNSKNVIFRSHSGLIQIWRIIIGLTEYIRSGLSALGTKLPLTNQRFFWDFLFQVLFKSEISISYFQDWFKSELLLSLIHIAYIQRHTSYQSIVKIRISFKSEINYSVSRSSFFPPLCLLLLRDPTDRRVPRRDGERRELPKNLVQPCSSSRRSSAAHPATRPAEECGPVR